MTDTLTISNASGSNAAGSNAAGSNTGDATVVDDVLDGRVLSFVRPLIGFPDTARFTLRSLGEAYEPFAALASLDEEGLSFIVVPPGSLFPDYVIEIPASDVALLELAGGDDVEVLTLVTRRPGATPVVNLMGPLVVNRRTGSASQVVLQDTPYGVTVPVDSGTARASGA